MINTYINDFKWHINYLSILIWYSCSNLVVFTTIEVESNQKKKNNSILEYACNM